MRVVYDVHVLNHTHTSTEMGSSPRSPSYDEKGLVGTF